MMTSFSPNGHAHGSSSDTFIDTDGGGLESGDATSLSESDLSLDEDGNEGDTAFANVGLDLSVPADLTGSVDPLEALLAAVPEPVSEPASGGFSLEGLLAESMQTVAESAAIKSARKRLKDTRITKAERQVLEAKIQTWEVQREWTPKATVAMFHKQACECGSGHAILAGIFQRQEHRTSAVTRWVDHKDVHDDGLPRESKVHTTKVLICADCAEKAGYGDCRSLNNFPTTKEQ